MKKRVFNFMEKTIVFTDVLAGPVDGETKRGDNVSQKSGPRSLACFRSEKHLKKTKQLTSLKKKLTRSLKCPTWTQNPSSENQYCSSPHLSPGEETTATLIVHPSGSNSAYTSLYGT